MYFEKRASLWKILDIQELAGTEENVHSEFKKPSELLHNNTFARDKFAKDLAETVSAFLNSDGGVILIGVQTDKYKKDRKQSFYNHSKPGLTSKHLSI
jgi:predicted HTH transcriptional regulator